MITGALTDDWETILWDWLFAVGSPSAPAGYFLALYTSSPADDESGAEVANANGYARVTLAGLLQRTANTVDLSADVDFAQASGSWGTVTHWAICEAGTHGVADVIVYGDFTAGEAVESGAIFTVTGSSVAITFATGALFDEAKALLLDWLFGLGSPTRPTAFHAALWSSDPGDDESGAELTGNGYSRSDITAKVSVTTGVMGLSASHSGWLASGGAWTGVTHGSIHSAASATGNGLVYQALTPSGVVVPDGAVYRWPTTLTFSAG